ncbi:MAG TPA: hypothetical protein VL738_09555 [Dactylosporangium sp.]|nr:hypothetical protein [Dactylosporangium sp.]
MSDQYPPPGSYPPPGGGGYPPPGGDQPQYGPPSSGAPYGPPAGNPYEQQPPAYGQPPSSGSPYDQQPPAYGQPPSSGGPYGQQPPAYGQPPAGNPYEQQPPAYGAPGAPGMPPFGAPPPPKKSNVGKIIGIIALVVVLLCAGCGIFGWKKISDVFESSSANAKVGDCLAGDSISDNTADDVSVKIVKCDAADAKYKVIGIKGSVTRTEALKDETTVCDAYTDAKYVLWQGTGTTGDALCLDDAK